MVKLEKYWSLPDFFLANLLIMSFGKLGVVEDVIRV